MNIEDVMNPTVRDLPPSGIRKFFDVVSTMPDSISLGVGEPDFVTPWHIREAGIWSLENGETSYTSNSGLMELREEIAGYLKHRFEVEYQPATQICVTVGASEGIDLSLRTIVQPGDEILIPDPSYVSYAPCVKLCGAVPVPVPVLAEDGFKIMPEQLERMITPKTKAMILPYPNNPTGGIMGRESLEAIAKVIAKTDLIVISDEIYGELTYTEERHVCFAEIPGMYERTILLSGFSKAFAMTGWRVGYVCAHPSLMQGMVKIHQYTMLCASYTAQRAAQEALMMGRQNNYRDIETMKREYNRRRRVIVSGFNELGLTCFEPRGAFYVFPCIKHTGVSSEEFCEMLLREEKVAIVPGTAFGASGEGYLRASYAASMEKIKEALQRTGNFLQRHGMM